MGTPHAAPAVAEHAGSHQPGSATSAGRLGSLKLALFAGVVLILIGVVAFAVSREVAVPAQRQAATAALPIVVAQRPALSPAEQDYIEALWPIHNGVERSVVRVALGASFYRLQDIDRVELRARLDQALTTYVQAEQQLTSLQPPPSLQAPHDDYVEAVRLFAASANEMLKMFEDGDEEHLAVGFPIAQEGSDRIRQVGNQLFPDQYPPN